MTPDRKKPGVAFWATVVVVLPLLYMLSFGPVCWTLTMLGDPDWALPAYWWVYAPIISLYENGPKGIHDAIAWYASLGR